MPLPELEAAVSGASTSSATEAPVPELEPPVPEPVEGIGINTLLQERKWWASTSNSRGKITSAARARAHLLC